MQIWRGSPTTQSKASTFGDAAERSRTWGSGEARPKNAAQIHSRLQRSPSIHLKTNEILPPNQIHPRETAQPASRQGCQS